MIDTTEGRAAWDRDVTTVHGRARAAAAALIGMGFTHICITALSEPQIIGMLVGSSTDRSSCKRRLRPREELTEWGVEPPQSSSIR